MTKTWAQESEDKLNAFIVTIRKTNVMWAVIGTGSNIHKLKLKINYVIHLTDSPPCYAISVSGNTITTLHVFNVNDGTYFCTEEAANERVTLERVGQRYDHD